MKKTVITLLALTVLFITGCTTTKTNISTSNQSGGVIEAQDGLVYDFGEIDINGGIVSKIFTFKNTDSKPLEIYEATTSCGCTTGEIKIGEKTYGPFGMGNKTERVISVPAGESFSVNVYYDPLFHGPKDLGKRQRTLFLFSSAMADGKVVRKYNGKPNFTEVSVKGVVVNK